MELDDRRCGATQNLVGARAPELASLARWCQGRPAANETRGLSTLLAAAPFHATTRAGLTRGSVAEGMIHMTLGIPVVRVVREGDG
jgi:hypothetical protein